MIDVEGILTKVEANGVRVVRKADVAIDIAGCTSGCLADLIRFDLNGKSGKFETVQGTNAYGAARFAGLEGDDVDPDEIGDAILDKYPNLLLVPPAGTKGTEPWLVFTVDPVPATGEDNDPALQNVLDNMTPEEFDEE